MGGVKCKQSLLKSNIKLLAVAKVLRLEVSMFSRKTTLNLQPELQNKRNISKHIYLLEHPSQ